ncbi:MAG: hypothetical protein J7J19_04750 [Thaumarchaeota archaeon]|nr:hypothetical protein [Nitrososphaerota archaeon]
MSRRIRFRFSSGIEVVGLIEDEKAAEELLKNSPFESTANRWGDEIYFELPFDLGLKGERVVMRVGEIAYWPEGELAVHLLRSNPSQQAWRTQGHKQG